MIGFGISTIGYLFYYGLSFVLVLLVLPRVLFVNSYSEQWERSVSDILKMSVVLLLLGHVLIMLNLFELISMAFLMVFIANRIYKMRRTKRGLDDGGVGFEALIYDYFDGKYTVRALAAQYAKNHTAKLKAIMRQQFSLKTKFIGSISLLLLLAFSAMVRFYEGVVEGSLSYGDRYTTLRWLKDVRGNLLYSDGVAPQGFHVFWATLQEFTRMDTLFVIQYTGPFTQLLIMLGIYFFISRLTGHRGSGIIGITLYALAGEALDSNYWMWQLESGPKTFVHVFLLPTIYFFVVYMRQGHQDAFKTFLAGTTVIAFVDPISALYVLGGVTLLSVYFSVAKMKSTRSSIAKSYVAWFVAAAVSIVPMLIAIVLGKDIHVSFVQSFQNDPTDPFLLAPSPSLLPLGFSILGGWTAYRLFRIFMKTSSSKTLENITLIAVLVGCLMKPMLYPIHAVQVDWEATIQQYAAISSENRTNEWMIVSKEPLSAVTKGKGYHMNITSLVSQYDPTKPSLTLNGSDKPHMSVAPHTFIVYEKKLYPAADLRAAEQLKPMYDLWRQQMATLREWLDVLETTLGPEIVYYEDSEIIIYHLEREEERAEIEKKVWGGGE
jgi:hypothetical protein